MIKILLVLLFVVLSFVDYRQTLEIARDPRFWEINPILGRSPKPILTRVYFIVCGILVVTGFVILPAPFNWLIISFSIGIEFAFVFHNYRIGVRP